MDLRTALHDAISPRTRRKGESYADQGRVLLQRVSPTLVEAVVLGTTTYDVSAKIDEYDNVSVGCSCPAFGRYGPCKHLWALAVEMDRDGGPSRSDSYSDDVDPLRTKALDSLDEPDSHGTYDDPDPIESLFAPHQRRRTWRMRLEELRSQTARAPDAWAGVGPSDMRILFSVDLEQSKSLGGLVVGTWWRKRLVRGGWGRARFLDPYSARAVETAGPEDRELLALLTTGDTRVADPWAHTWQSSFRLSVPGPMVSPLIPRLCRTGRFHIDSGPGWHDAAPLVLDEGPPWVLALRWAPRKGSTRWEVTGTLVRGEERIDLDVPDLLLETGFALVRGTAARFDPRGAMAWVSSLRRDGPLHVPAREKADLLAVLLEIPEGPILEVDGLEPPRTVSPRPHLHVSRPEGNPRKRPSLTCRIAFDYEGHRVQASDPAGHLLADADQVPIRRHREAEQAALQQFLDAGGERTDCGPDEWDGRVAGSRLPMLVRNLLEAGWAIDADGVRYRPAGAFHLSVQSGIDWFDLEGGMEFDGHVISLPALLEAARRGSRTVALGDGSVGLLPEKWLEGWGFVDAVGRVEGDHLRFKANQGWILDALLAQQDGVETDRKFKALQKRLHAFRGIQPAKETQSFRGTLRSYQRDGLAWLRFLEQTGLGGCLADDMGLGKTVQVLALLEARCDERKKRYPTLVVAPRSVVFNWIEEAARFAPRLRVLDYTGLGRKQKRRTFADHDLIVTTYGTLRRDITILRHRRFDTVILDESQAIKNAQSQSAKAARLLKADHRLAMSGTPIENHLGELWSLFEFLNPGMLGRAKAFQEMAGGQNGQALDEKGRAQLARALGPFLLRRTKEQVLDDLPEKTEQILHCEMKAPQKQDYQQIVDHIRSTVLSQAKNAESLDGMKLHILEALLRLRQAACHPGLLDAKRRGESSAKLDVLLPLLDEVAGSGHKALVFSQFTCLLGIVRDRLDERALPYEYLDGRTRNRQAKVERFQNDPARRVFLISLKAGGLGLNLTAADYVFLLDPWWNPAVERQAVDRTHRIGQTRPVMAYRLICQDTVEEKILALQDEKRELAEALITANASILKTLTREDLDTLLS